MYWLVFRRNSHRSPLARFKRIGASIIGSDRPASPHPLDVTAAMPERFAMEE
ncbi:hypothetical protein [Paenibacillus apiarius]|uniref:Uncharacterized protein n=1 Tax=Paenibacillus apiarius TaxID=46240 RepID=A0ABT4DNS5_9BACL|nr:hypothetical protein [Paenibacillus apiarius]MCY9515476.1 hypothetical protein [Paenibacillus apiarius]MCY9518885.1 hypothetical protein [Paenibacillus apiarius]MCY9552069.1 hypothetical protein [Paenibacillus apiarius]MCY9682566.1 hypothetical protein [Paenibacillus apiarius]MCY9723938.1 hypothetical protein [Paenibacillus apiarius]